MSKLAALLGSFAVATLGCSLDPDLKYLHLEVKPGFTGDLKVVESASVAAPDQNHVTLRQSGDTLLAPVGFLKGTKAWTVVELKDTDGKSLPADLQTPKGTIAFRGSHTTQDGFFFVVSDGR